MPDITALARVSSGRHTYVLHLTEGSRASWQVFGAHQPRRLSHISPGSPDDVLAAGLLGLLALQAPAALVADPVLAGAADLTTDGLRVRQLSTTEQELAFRAAARSMELDLTLFPGTCLDRAQVQAAHRAGVVIRLSQAARLLAERN